MIELHRIVVSLIIWLYILVNCRPGVTGLHVVCTSRREDEGDWLEGV